MLDACQKEGECGAGYRCENMRCIPDGAATSGAGMGGASTVGPGATTAPSSVTAVTSASTATGGTTTQCMGPCFDCVFGTCAANVCEAATELCKEEPSCKALYACYQACDGEEDVPCIEACEALPDDHGFFSELSLCIVCELAPCGVACADRSECPK